MPSHYGRIAGILPHIPPQSSVGKKADSLPAGWMRGTDPLTVKWNKRGGRGRGGVGGGGGRGGNGNSYTIYTVQLAELSISYTRIFSVQREMCELQSLSLAATFARI